MQKTQKYNAWFISPSGALMPMGDSLHIKEVIKNPEYFGYTLQEIQTIYDEYNETLGTEEKAREKILLSLIQKGWIRARKFYRPDRWTVNVHELNSSVKQNLQEWAKELINNGYSPNEDVVIDTPTCRKIYTLQSLKDNY